MAFLSIVADSAAASDQQADDPPDCQLDPQHSQPERVFRVPAPASRCVADLRLALKDRGLSSQAISLIVRGVPDNSQWKLWKKWRLDNSLPSFTSQSVDECEYFDATVQLMHFFSARFSAGDLGSCRSAASTVISCLFNCASLSDSPQVSHLFMSFSKDKVSQPQWSVQDDA